MPYLKYKTPKFDSGANAKLIDITELWDNFRSVERIVNGNLGVENIKGGKVSTSMLTNTRAWGSAGFKFGAGWPASGVLMYPPVDLLIQKVVVDGASRTFSATLASGGSSAVVNDAGGRISYHAVNVFVTASADTNLTWNVTAGSCTGISIYYTVGHQS
jgi:hypothetical protein